jgi:hypothetical protein
MAILNQVWKFLVDWAEYIEQRQMERAQRTIKTRSWIE